MVGGAGRAGGAAGGRKDGSNRGSDSLRSHTGSAARSCNLSMSEKGLYSLLLPLPLHPLLLPLQAWPKRNSLDTGHRGIKPCLLAAARDAINKPATLYLNEYRWRPGDTDENRG